MDDEKNPHVWKGRGFLGGGNSNIFGSFIPIWGRWTHFDSYFSKGLKPPTRLGFCEKKVGGVRQNYGNRWWLAGRRGGVPIFVGASRRGQDRRCQEATRPCPPRGSKWQLLFQKGWRHHHRHCKKGVASSKKTYNKTGFTMAPSVFWNSWGHPVGPSRKNHGRRSWKVWVCHPRHSDSNVNPRIEIQNARFSLRIQMEKNSESDWWFRNPAWKPVEV